MKKLLFFLAAMFMVATVYPQVGLGLGYNVGSEGQGFSLDFELMHGYGEFGFEGDFLLKDRFEVTVHAGPRFPAGNQVTISPCVEFGYRTPKSAVIGGSIITIYNPYKCLCLFAKAAYEATVQAENKEIEFSPGGFKLVFGMMLLR